MPVAYTAQKCTFLISWINKCEIMRDVRKRAMSENECTTSASLITFGLVPPLFHISTLLTYFLHHRVPSFFLARRSLFLIQLSLSITYQLRDSSLHTRTPPVVLLLSVDRLWYCFPAFAECHQPNILQQPIFEFHPSHHRRLSKKLAHPLLLPFILYYIIIRLEEIRLPCRSGAG